MENISVIIFAPKEDKNIKDCIISAELLTENIILVYPSSSFVETVREAGIKQAKTDWILILDADERMTKKLAEEIKDVIRHSQIKLDKIGKNTNSIRLNPISSDFIGAYKIPRKNIFGRTKWLKYGGWSPDYQIRLINKKYFVDWPKRIHSTPKIKGQIGYLKNPLIHYFHGDLSKMVEKTVIFEGIESDLLYKAGKTASTLTFFRKYLAELWRRMFKGLGFLDGTIGVIESIYQAFSKTITYLFLYEKNRNKKL